VVHLRVLVARAGFGGEGFESEEVFFDGFEAVKTPVVDGESSGEPDFEVAARVEFPDVFADGEDVFFAIVFGHDGGAAGEGVFEAVEFGEWHMFLSLDLDSGMRMGWIFGGWAVGC
jgi:hypothetical protein